MKQGEILAKANLEEMVCFIQMKEVLDLPFLFKFSVSENYRQLVALGKYLPDSKYLLKSIKVLSEYEDFKDDDRIATPKTLALFRELGEFTPQALEIFKSKINSFHILKELIPYFKDCNNNELFAAIKKIGRYCSKDFGEILMYLNHKKIQKAILNDKSKKNIFEIIRSIKKSNLLREESKRYKKEYGKNYKEILEFRRSMRGNCYSYFNEFDIPGLKITKEPVEIDFWGKETHCCLKFGGAAEALIDVMEFSPIAGELVGTYRGDKLSSFVWDMIECIDGKAYKTLILDNIESPSKLNEQTTEKLFDDLFSYGKYKNIYLGTVRDDCTINEKYEIKDRQSTIVGFDKQLKKSVFTTEDSKKLYIMRERKEKTISETRKMNVTDLHHIKYLEKYIYGDIYKEDDKTDILKQVTLDTPCYIVDNETNIYGYLLTKWKYFDKEGNEVFDDKGVKKFYIEDLVMSKSKMLHMRDIISDLLDWLKKNNIKEVYANTNIYSKNFIKRLEREGIKVCRENMNMIIPENILR